MGPESGMATDSSINFLAYKRICLYPWGKCHCDWREGETSLLNDPSEERSYFYENSIVSAEVDRFAVTFIVSASPANLPIHRPQKNGKISWLC
jgi:hypothetical protein